MSVARVMEILAEGPCGAGHVTFLATLDPPPEMLVQLRGVAGGPITERLTTPLVDAVAVLETVAACVAALAQGTDAIVTRQLSGRTEAVAHHTPWGLALVLGSFDADGTPQLVPGAPPQAIMVESDGITAFAELFVEALVGLVDAGMSLAVVRAAGSA